MFGSTGKKTTTSRVDSDQIAATRCGDYAKNCYPGGLVGVVLIVLNEGAEGYAEKQIVD